MGNLLERIYAAMQRYRLIGAVLLVAAIAALVWSALRLNIEEDITRTFPRTEEFAKYENLYRNSAISGNVVIGIGPRAVIGDAAMADIGERIADGCRSIDTTLVREVRFGSDASALEESFGRYVQHLPYFLTAIEIDSLFAGLDEAGISTKLERTLNRLRSYESIGTKKLLAKDPLGLANPVLQRLSKMQEGSALRIEDGFTFTPDGEYLLLIVTPANPPSETVSNTLMVDTLETIVNTERLAASDADILLFGGPVIAVGNSRQIKKDSQLVGFLAGGLILLLLILHFRSIVTPVLFFLPPLFGVLFALGVLAWWQGGISAISIAAGTIVLGIAIDYSFHFFNHYRETGSVRATLREVSSPMLLGCFTTVLVFFCLNFLRSEVLADFGKFAGLSLIGTAGFALLVLPHLVRRGNRDGGRGTGDEGTPPLTPPYHEGKFVGSPHPNSEQRTANGNSSLVPRPSSLFSTKAKLAAFLAIVAATIFFYQYAGDVQFEDDLNRINYFPAEMQRAQDIIVGSSDRESIFVLSSGESLGEAVAGMGKIPSANTSQPSANTSQPLANDSQPLANDSQPSANDSQPSVNTSKPSVNDSEPSANSPQSSVNGSQSSVNTSSPPVNSSQPSAHEYPTEHNGFTWDDVKVTSLTDIILTTEQLEASIAAWNRHVGRDTIDRVSENRVSTIRTIGEKQGFRPSFFDAYEDLFRPIELDAEAFYRDFILNDGLFRELVFVGDDGYTVVSTVNLPKAEKAAFKDLVEQNAPQLEVVARSSLALDLVNTVSEDLNFMLLLSGGLVFIILLLTYGRIELTIITFLPMVVSWVWILGICGLTGIKFNMVNVLITTFVFGLGDDYSIFISDGILSRYKYGLDKLKSFRGSIILSAATTIIGTGVLIFSKHPALNSIAVLSVTGMVCVVVAALTLQPLLYEVMVESRKKRGFSPLELRDLLRAALAFGWFFIGCIILTAILFILMPLPLSKRRKQRIMMPLISALIKSDVDIMTHAKQRWINKQPLEKPAILIANHASFVDLMLMIGSSNKLLLVTNDWVWNSPFFGAFIRYVEYIHAKDETSWDLEKIRKKVDEGYSILIFPEGTRSLDGRIGRFKKGAFYLAEQLKLDIQPVILHGIHHALRKGDFSVQKSLMTIKYLPRIAADDPAFGTGYRERTKAIAKHFKAEFEQVREEVETPDFFADKVQRLYTYKGPVLEWYVRIKMMLERNFSAIAQHVPKEGKVYDLGCGYGYLTHLLAMQSYKRHVIGLDYDAEKIQVAANTHYNMGNIAFAQADLTQFTPESADCFIIKDVLHYMPVEAQERLLDACAEKLNAGGVIIVRDGMEDGENGKLKIENGSDGKHAITKLTEFFSITLFGFNKAEHGVNFPTEPQMHSFAARHGLRAETQGNKVSSNVVWVFRKE
jgi:1-acyl-sn-glycerol-3-phosphate acyltransferase